MKKLLLSLLTLFALSASAQNEIVVGDMNDDGLLTIGDVTVLTETILGNLPKRTVSAQCGHNITEPAYTWESSDESIISINSDGSIKPVNYGKCTLVATATDGSGLKAYCTVDIKMPDLHEYVDLGLTSGTLWATCNVGAEKPEDYGDHFAWGEVEEEKDWTKYKFYTSSLTITKYSLTDKRTELELEDDAAHVNWGVGWRMPSREQFLELYEECKYTWTKLNGVQGYLIESKVNNNSIFLPAGGYENSSGGPFRGTCRYWSRTVYGSGSYPYKQAWYLDGTSSKFYPSSEQRTTGHTIRPVRASTQE